MIKAKWGEKTYLPRFNVFIIISYNYCKFLLFKLLNKVKKIIVKVHTKEIFLTILHNTLNRGLALYYMANSICTF